MAKYAQGAQIICSQELFTSVYFCQIEDHKYFQLGETILGPTTERCRRWRRSWAW